MRPSGLKFSIVLTAISVCLILTSCANLPLKEGGLALDKHTTAGIDDIGVGRVTRQF